MSATAEGRSIESVPPLAADGNANYDDEDDLRCCVCGYDMPFDDNDIVACSGCPVVVHQNCYGIKVLNKNGDWFCRACSHDLPPTASLTCELCPFKGVSALALTSDGKWVHGHCSSWLLKMDPDQHENMDLSANKVTEKCDTCAPNTCSKCIICGNRSKVIRCMATGCKNHFHPWCMSHHSGLPHKLVYWGHAMYVDDKEAIIPYHYCHEHEHMVPRPSDKSVHWHLPSNQITRNRRGTETTEEMQRLSGIKEGLETLAQPPATRPGPAGDVAHAMVVSLCNTAMSNAAGLRVSRALHPSMAVAAMIAKRIAKGRKGKDQRVQVSEQLAKELANMQFVCSYWLLYLVPHTQKWPTNVERNAREIQAHLSALRSLCRGLLEKVRTGPDPLEGVRINPVGGGSSWRKIRAENRLLALRGRDEFIARDERCVMCMVNTQPFGEDGPEYLPMVCRGCGAKRHKGCYWMCGRDNVCGLCDKADILRNDVCNNDMAAVHQRVLDWPGASPFWTPDPGATPDLSGDVDLEDLEVRLRGQTTALHEAARWGRYEVLSMLLHHCRGRGLLPAACLVPDGNGKTAFEVAIVKNQVECARLFSTTFSDLPNFAPRLGWRKGQRSGKDISGGREGVAIPWVNEVDDEPFPSHSFTYVNRVVEGHGASFNWRLCHYEMPDRNPSACHHKEPDDSGSDLGAPTGLGGGGGMAGAGGLGGGVALPFQGIRGKGGCDAVRCGHVPRGSENGRRYECNYKCPCAVRLKTWSGGNAHGEESKDCGLRASQMGVRAPLEAFKTATKGWGIRATRTIEEGEYICSYAGEMITESVYQAREPEYELRDKRDKAGGACYCFNVFTHKTGKPENNIVVDADRYRGVAALFNHACCGANVKVRKVVGNNTDNRYPIHGFFALKRILVKEGQPKPELVFNYGAKEKPKPCLCSACVAHELSKRSDAPARLR
eukprot:g12018.t1